MPQMSPKIHFHVDEEISKYFDKDGIKQVEETSLNNLK